MQPRDATRAQSLSNLGLQLHKFYLSLQTYYYNRYPYRYHGHKYLHIEKILYNIQLEPLHNMYSSKYPIRIDMGYIGMDYPVLFHSRMRWPASRYQEPRRSYACHIQRHQDMYYRQYLYTHMDQHIRNPIPYTY